MGHFSIARSQGKDDLSWWDLKSVMPLLSKPGYAARLKSDPARGGEAVVMTENVRSYHDILLRVEAPYSSALNLPGLALGRRE